ncbi:hypothetical protein BKG96_10610 [Rodentibacter caecimuris]|uniref:Uncharacterized protein n=1 Tax=Rodentibacter caecimuris TaxID=1796644 RepID=A0A1V3KFH6_9PAST|nr:hypothetical protein [Rodentibacter heylii]OOF75549.1 hypothetical protein BKG96_10610 [Rodentibacter heylii]
MGIDTLKGVVSDGKEASKAVNDAGISNSFTLFVEGIGKKIGLNDSTAKFISSVLNNSLDYKENRDKNSEKIKEGEK